MKCEKCQSILDEINKNENSDSYEKKEVHLTNLKTGQKLTQIKHMVGNDAIPMYDPATLRSFASEGDPDAVEEDNLELD